MGNLPPRLGALRVAGLTPLQQYPARRLLARSGVDEVPDAPAVGDLVLVALERLPLEGARGVVIFQPVQTFLVLGGGGGGRRPFSA